MFKLGYRAAHSKGPPEGEICSSWATELFMAQGLLKVRDVQVGIQSCS